MMIRWPNSCGRLVLHLVRFHYISGEEKVVEGSEFRYLRLYRQLVGGGLHHQMEPHISSIDGV